MGGVVVVGGGPVGAVAANLLGCAGIGVVVVERERALPDLPRAAQLDDDALRVIQGIGLAEAVRPHTRPVRGLQLVHRPGRPFWHFRDTAAAGPGGWPPTNTIHQPGLEGALRDGLARFPHVRLELGRELVALEQDGTQVRARVRDVSSGETSTMAASFVLGCDGARSTVRGLLDVPVRDRGFAQRWLVVDTQLPGPLEAWPVPQQVCDPSRPATYVPMAGDRHRWEFLLHDGESAEDFLTEVSLAARVAPWTGGRPVEVVRQAVYTFHALRAERWRDGRVFLLGDAAHQMPPFLGQGLCAGIRDAGNLAWKLVLVLGGAGGDALLDTYERERAAHVDVATVLSTLVGRVVRGRGATAAAVRGGLAVARRLPERMRRPLEHVRTPGLARGPLVIDQPWGRLGEPLGRRAIGLPIPQPPVRAGGVTVPLDEVLGPGFALVGFGDHPHRFLGAEDRRFWLALGAATLTVAPREVEDVTGQLAAWFGRQRATLAVVRPDRYVLAVCGGGRNPSPASVTEQVRAVLSAP